MVRKTHWSTAKICGIISLAPGRPAAPAPAAHKETGGTPMTHEKTRFLAYICPRCRQSVIVEKDVFALAAAPAHIKCPCGKSELTVEFMPQRVTLSVPCVACGREHLVSCPSHAFLREKLWPSPAPPPAWTAAMWARRARYTPPPPGWSGPLTSWSPRRLRPDRGRGEAPLPGPPDHGGGFV